MSPRGIMKRVTIGGRRNRPVSSNGGTSLDAVERFMELQRIRVARRLQKKIEAQGDGMERHHALTETDITTR